ncbi:MAG TPA: YIP1 family protein [Thermoanaerobaculia bacterium]|nr:YIP1 family protein [Thermoanaerobaculia bacterium]
MHDSSFGRLLGVLVAPGKTFRSIAERPTWLAPLLVLLVLGTTAAYMMQQRVDQEELVRHQVSQFGMGNVSDDQIQEMVERNEKMGPVTLLVGPIMTAVVFLIVALVFWVAFKMVGSEMDFKSSLATSVHGLMPSAISLLLSILILLGRSTVTPEEAMSGGILTSSAATVAPEEASPVVKSLLGSLDVFSIWSLILLVIGYRVVAKVSPKAAAITVIALWLLYVLGKAGFAAAIGSMAGGAGS